MGRYNIFVAGVVFIAVIYFSFVQKIYIGAVFSMPTSTKWWSSLQFFMQALIVFPSIIGGVFFLKDSGEGYIESFKRTMSFKGIQISFVIIWFLFYVFFSGNEYYYLDSVIFASSFVLGILNLIILWRFCRAKRKWTYVFLLLVGIDLFLFSLTILYQYCLVLSDLGTQCKWGFIPI